MPKTIITIGGCFLAFILAANAMAEGNGITTKGNSTAKTAKPVIAQLEQPKKEERTMKILAIDKIRPGVTMDDIKPHLKDEALHTWKLYEQGIIREVYFRGDHPGAVVILECKDVDEARKIMDELPLVKNNLITFEFIPLQFFEPFSMLIKKD